MHSYLRAIGFSELKSETELEKILEDVYLNFEHRGVVKEEEEIFLEMSRSFAQDMGIRLCGTLDENGFHRQYYFPYFTGSMATTTEEVSVEKRAGGDSFAGICDDGRVGTSLIFYVQNPAAYRKGTELNFLGGRKSSTTLTGLSLQGTILLPIYKNQKTEDARRQGMVKRNRLLTAAKNGDQEAIESLTIEDMDLYSMISRRIETEDVFSIVDTCFMPYGIECDQYEIVGNINYYTKVRNRETEEYVYQMNLECNDMNLDICINEKDLLGDPAEGRRFKGNIWLQGKIDFN